jgi:Tfp pilus assembly protein PilO
MKKQVPVALVVAIALVIVGAVGYFILIRPKSAESAKLDEEIAAVEAKIAQAEAAARPAGNPQVRIKVADLFKLAKAMPAEDDMAGIILELNSVASATGVRFVSISPQPPVDQTTFRSLPIQLTFEGNYYDLTDFLFRLRNLVSVRDGRLDASGRLFTLDALDLHEGPDGFPQIQAALTVSAYVFAPAGAAPAPAPPTTTASSPSEAAGTTP